MKVLFDANTPAPLARCLRGHQVTRADELGWKGLDNGALLDAAERAGFDPSPLRQGPRHQYRGQARERKGLGNAGA